MSREQLEKVNGNSNLYFGWGGEDDDLYFRWVNKVPFTTWCPICYNKDNFEIVIPRHSCMRVWVCVGMLVRMCDKENVAWGCVSVCVCVVYCVYLILVHFCRQNKVTWDARSPISWDNRPLRDDFSRPRHRQQWEQQKVFTSFVLKIEEDFLHTLLQSICNVEVLSPHSLEDLMVDNVFHKLHRTILHRIFLVVL